MKILLLIRHAKSSWDNTSLSDFDRPLNERGKENAPVMAHRLKHKKIKIEAFVSSPAKRAKKTAKIFMKELGADENELILLPSLYDASVNDFYKATEELDDNFNCVALFSHNPGITDFINSLDCHPVYNMPTCGIYAIEIHTQKWDQFKEAEKKFLFFDFPKKEE
jgi:phosphohistidine phosphatase